MQLATRPWITTAVALVGAGAIAVTPLGAPLPAASALNVALTAGEMTVDLVRHGESELNAAHLLGTWPPGLGLTATGQQEAQDVGDALFAAHGPDYYDGIYAALLLRTQETAGPLADLLGMTPQLLAGLNELAAPAIAENLPELSPAGLLYILPAVLWSLGLYLVPSLGTVDVNGVVFNERVNDALATMYAEGDANGDSEIHNVAFTSMGTILLWSLMNTKNPDLGIMLSHLVPNAAVIEVEGNPDDGWTLVSWDGEPVGPASLLTSLFVQTRELLTVPQVALWDISRALASADLTMILNSLQTGLTDIVTTLLNYPGAVIQDIIDALNPVHILPAAATDVAALGGDEVSSLTAALGDALAAI